MNLAFARTWPERDGSTASDVIHACDKEEVRSEFIGWEEEVQQLIQVSIIDDYSPCHVLSKAVVS